MHQLKEKSDGTAEDPLCIQLNRDIHMLCFLDGNRYADSQLQVSQATDVKLASKPYYLQGVDDVMTYCMRQKKDQAIYAMYEYEAEEDPQCVQLNHDILHAAKEGSGDLRHVRVRG